MGSATKFHLISHHGKAPLRIGLPGKVVGTRLTPLGEVEWGIPETANKKGFLPAEALVEDSLFQLLREQKAYKAKLADESLRYQGVHDPASMKRPVVLCRPAGRAA